jgi:hypothetical protein
MINLKWLSQPLVAISSVSIAFATQSNFHGNFSSHANLQLYGHFYAPSQVEPQPQDIDERLATLSGYFKSSTLNVRFLFPFTRHEYPLVAALCHDERLEEVLDRGQDSGQSLSMPLATKESIRASARWTDDEDFYTEGDFDSGRLFFVPGRGLTKRR